MNYGDWNTKTVGHLRSAFGAKVMVRVDIANFFGSIYTHSIAWAAVGHLTAKANIGKPFWYNDLDAAFQFCKRRETNGVAIGPGASNIIAEMILGKVDANLQKYLFHRYIDDYVAFCESRSQADDFIRDLEVELSKFKLALNHRKTSVTPLPEPVSSPWVIDMRRHVRMLPEVVRPAQAVDFLDKALLLSELHKDRNILKYALRAMASRQRHFWTDSVIIEYGLLSWADYPSLFPALAPFIAAAGARSGPLILQEKLLAILDDSLSRRRSDLACWAMYYLSLIGGRLPDASLANAVLSLDCLSILTAFRFSTSIQRSAFRGFVDRLIAAPDMHDRHRYWILLYELFRIDFLKKAGDETGVYRVLKNNDVQFMPSLA